MTNIEAGMRPTAINQMFYNKVNELSIIRIFHKAIYYGLMARSSLNINPMYAFVYGVARGATDFIMASLQYKSIHGEPGDHLKSGGLARVKKTLYVATNFFVSIAILYGICKIGELVYWGGKSLIGTANYRPFGILQLIKFESITFLVTTVLDLGCVTLDKSVNDYKKLFKKS